MSVYLQNEVWWYEFTFNKQRIRKSSKSTDKAMAKLIEAEHLRSLREGTGGISPTYQALNPQEPAKAIKPPVANEPPVCPTSNMTLAGAGELWLTQKTWKRRKPKTIECCQGYIKALIAFFGDMRLQEFHPGSLLAYQEHRIKTAGPSAINHELNALSQMLKQAGLWDKIKTHYAPLGEPEWQKPEVMSLEEQQRIFAYASEDPNLLLAELVFTITRNTSASGTELRLARHRQLDLTSDPPVFEVTGDTTKNTVRPRRIPLNEAGADAFQRVIVRAAKMGSHQPYHFLFPKTVNRCTWDPNQPASKSWLRHQSKELRELANVPKMTPHLWRKQIATEMLEAGKTRDQVVAVCGWVSEAMIATYCHMRMDAKVDAIGGVSDLKKSPDSPALPEPPQPNVQAELAQLRQLVEQLQAQAQKPPAAAKKRRELNRPAQNEMIQRQSAGLVRPGLIQFPHRSA